MYTGIMVSTTLTVLIISQMTTFISAVPQLPRKCKLSDSTCVKTVAQGLLPSVAAGIPELNMEPLDVMHIDKIKLDVAGLKSDVTDAYVKGLKNAVINSISFDVGKKVLKLLYRMDMNMKSQYKASGQLLVLPISGDGDMSIDLKNLHTEMTMPFNIVKNNNGKETLELKSYQYKYDVKGGAHFRLTNLFNGNKQLSDTLLSFMNDNWKTLSVEFGRPMLDKVQRKIFESIKTYLGSQPLENFVDN